MGFRPVRIAHSPSEGIAQPSVLRSGVLASVDRKCLEVVFIMDYVPQVFRRGEVVPNSCRGAAPKYVRRYCSMGHAGQALSQGD